MNLSEAFLVIFALMTVVGFSVTAADKKFSKQKGHRRIPEKTFVILSFLGGGYGVLAAFFLCRHKTRHLGLIAAVTAATLICTGITFLAAGNPL